MTRPDAEYTERVNAWWREREVLFRESDESPLPPEKRAKFSAFPRYDVDDAYRLVTDLKPVPEGTTEAMGSTGGDPREYPVIGLATGTVGGHEIELRVLEIEGDPWVPFRDATSGNETYGAGRYLDVEYDDHGRAVLDFNYAYHPFCAFNDEWSCALPPRANHLAVPVRAGERL